MKKTNDFGKDPIPVLVLKVSVPFMFAQFVNVLYSIVDRIYIGNIPVMRGLRADHHAFVLIWNLDRNRRVGAFLNSSGSGGPQRGGKNFSDQLFYADRVVIGFDSGFFIV